MNRRVYCLSGAVAVAMLLLRVGSAYGQTQTPGQVTQFDPSLNVVDSVITQDPSGNIGIGTTSPLGQLHVVGNDPVRILGDLSTLSGSESVDFMARNSQFSSDIGGMRVQRDPQTGDVNTLLLAARFGTLASEMMRVNGNGKVGIGTTSPDQLLSVNGDASKAGGGAWQTFSDERLKTVHGSFNAGLEEILTLKPIRYTYNRDNPLALPDEGEHIGLSAQEVEKVIPEAVTKNSEGYRMLNNDPVLWAMLNAIKEQQARISELKVEVEALKAKLSVEQ